MCTSFPCAVGEGLTRLVVLPVGALSSVLHILCWWRIGFRIEIFEWKRVVILHHYVLALRDTCYSDLHILYWLGKASIVVIYGVYFRDRTVHNITLNKSGMLPVENVITSPLNIP